MNPTLRYAARSETGLRRDGNEDAGYAGPRLLAVADGMGGHAAGEVASAVAIASLAELDEDVPGADLLAALRRAAESANTHMSELVGADDALEGMGTTLTAVLTAGSRLGLLHVGDSRAYLFRDGSLTQITHDHTLVQRLVDEGRLQAQEANSHPQRALLTRALDGRGDVELDLSVREARVGDRYLLCTDGLSGVVSHETIGRVLDTPDPQEAVDTLVELALRGGGPDNVTCIVADVVDRSTPDTDGRPVVAGAAATSAPMSRPAPDTAASRAVVTRRPRRRLSSSRLAVPGRRDRPKKPRRTGRVVVVALVAVVLIAAAAGGGWAYLNSIYYVGVDDGSVAIHRGVAGSVAGVPLSSVHRRLDVPLEALPPVTRGRVADGITAGDLADAERIVDRLRDQARLCPEPAPAGGATTPTPAATPTPTGTDRGAAPTTEPATDCVPRR